MASLKARMLPEGLLLPDNELQMHVRSTVRGSKRHSRRQTGSFASEFTGRDKIKIRIRGVLAAHIRGQAVTAQQSNV